MNLFERLMGKQPISEKSSEAATATTTETTPETARQIRSTHDFMQAIGENRLAEAEAFLLAEKENPSQMGHNELWFNNQMIILLSALMKAGDKEGAQRINDLLPENLQQKM